MARSVNFDFRKGSGASTEILFGTVELKPTMMFTTGTSAVLPVATKADLIDGKVTIPNVAPSPAPVSGQVEWAYSVKILDRFGKQFEWLVGVPDAVTPINFVELPRYFETKPPLFGQGPQGVPGNAATIQVGSVGSGVSPSITNVGTSQNATLDFVLPKGEKGDSGIQGVPGTPSDLSIAIGDTRYGNYSLQRWHRKLRTNPNDLKIVFMGDSTTDEATAAGGIYTRLKSFHTLEGQGLAGILPANIISVGHNGSTRAQWASSQSWKDEVTAPNPSLIVYSYGINDVKSGATSQAQLRAGIITDITYLRSVLPEADIILRIPNSFTTDDVAAKGFVTPNASAQAYTDLLRNAYISLDKYWPDVVVWNSQDRLFGRTCVTQASTKGLMFDQLHPSDLGYQWIADTLVSDLLGRSRTVTTYEDSGNLTIALDPGYLGQGTPVPTVRRINETAQIRGLVKLSAGGAWPTSKQIIATLPQGFRPLMDVYGIVTTSDPGTVAQIVISTSGTIGITCSSTSPTWVSLNAVQYPVI